jgi:glycosyltransferase involved in cell wall biosynthesis
MNEPFGPPAGIERLPALRGIRFGWTRQPRIWFEVDNLLTFLNNIGHPTGIQRVCIELLTAAYQEFGSRVQVCRFNAVQFSCHRLEFRELLSELHSFGSADERVASRSTRPKLVQKLADFIRTKFDRLVRPTFEYWVTPGDIMICLTSPLQSHRYADDVKIVKRCYHMKFAMFVHDIMPVTHPQWFPDGNAGKFSKALDDALALSDVMVTSSEHNGREITAYCDRHQLQTPLIKTVRFGDGFSGNAAFADEKQLALPDKFVLFVSTIEVRKNHVFLLRVWKRLLQRHGSEAIPSLVFFGGLGWNLDELMEELNSSNYLDGKIVILSGLSDAALREAYQRCMFTVYASLGEGWGLPVAEGLAAGRFCVCSNRFPLPQVGGDLIDYFDPIDEQDAQAKLERAMFDQNYRDARTARIIAEYRPTSWQDCTRSLVAALRTLDAGQTAAAPGGTTADR